MAKTDDYYQIHIARFQYLISQIKSLQLPSSAKILDVGCYPPYIFNELQKTYPVYGLSSPQEPFRHPNVKIVDIESEPIPFPNTNFDLIIFAEIIEHLTNPIAVINKLVPLLKKDGFLIITTPNIFRWQNIISLIFGRNIYFPLFQLEQPINFRHQREYSLKELISLGSQCHLKLLKSSYFIAYPPNRLKNKTDRLTLKFVKYINFIFSLIFPSHQDSLFLLFRK